jgi:hypothetical protein
MGGFYHGFVSILCISVRLVYVHRFNYVNYNGIGNLNFVYLAEIRRRSLVPR